MKIIRRDIEKQVLQSLKVFPAVYVNGPRQAGKTTLVRVLLADKFPARFITFDDVLERGAAMRNPQAYLADAGFPLIIDEVQAVPDIVYPLKMLIDEQRYENLKRGSKKPNGRYLLTGSANLAITPKLADAMVGRMGTVTLLPLSACEYWRGNGDFIARIFAKDFAGFNSGKHSLMDAIYVGTYPELIGMKSDSMENWFQNYIRKITLEDRKKSIIWKRPSTCPRYCRAWLCESAI